jgi:glutathionylspermidine synthase
VNGLYVQPSSFSVGGAYAASAARVDESLVITADSDNVALRVVEDDRFLDLARR